MTDETMTIQEIQGRIREIKEGLDDPEKAHSLEDRLRMDFIRHVAANGLWDWDVAQKARLVMTTNDLCFGRWMA